MSLQLFDVSQKNILITGSTQGLGRSIAEGLGKAGATVILNARNPQKLDAAIADFKSKGIKVHGYLFDVTDKDGVKAAIEKIEQEIGAIDVLINNAGIIKRVPLHEMEESDFSEVINTNLIAPFIVAKYVAQKMIARRKGKIINMCSMMSELGRDGVGAYAAAKGGLKMLTRNMATEWARYNIQVNGIGPGYYETDITAPIRTPGHPFNEFIINRTPAGRWGKPEELVGAAIFLSSAASDFVNGHVLYVDGGILATIGKPHES